MSDAATLRTYAAVFAMPRRYERGGKLYPASSECVAASRALLVVARMLEMEPAMAAYYDKERTR